MQSMIKVVHWFSSQRILITWPTPSGRCRTSSYIKLDSAENLCCPRWVLHIGLFLSRFKYFEPFPRDCPRFFSCWWKERLVIFVWPRDLRSRCWAVTTHPHLLASASKDLVEQFWLILFESTQSVLEHCSMACQTACTLIRDKHAAMTCESFP